jgi:hypothetical protein
MHHPTVLHLLPRPVPSRPPTRFAMHASRARASTSNDKEGHWRLADARAEVLVVTPPLAAAGRARAEAPMRSSPSHGRARRTRRRPGRRWILVRRARSRACIAIQACLAGRQRRVVRRRRSRCCSRRWARRAEPRFVRAYVPGRGTWVRLAPSHPGAAPAAEVALAPVRSGRAWIASGRRPGGCSVSDPRTTRYSWLWNQYSLLSCPVSAHISHLGVSVGGQQAIRTRPSREHPRKSLYHNKKDTEPSINISSNMVNVCVI